MMWWYRQPKTAIEKLLINTNLRISTDHQTLHIRQHKLYICNCQHQWHTSHFHHTARSDMDLLLTHKNHLKHSSINIMHHRVPHYSHMSHTDINKMLSYHRDYAVEWVSFGQNGKTIFCSGHYKSVFNHCDVMNLQSYQIERNNAT